MAKREYFPCYHSYLKKCEKLTDQELGRLFRALLEYSITGERRELAGRESIAFDFMADDIDRASLSYDEKCDINFKNGKRGGRPKNQTVSKKPNGFKKSQSEGEYKGEGEYDTYPPSGGVSACAREDSAAVAAGHDDVLSSGPKFQPADPQIAAVFTAYDEKIGAKSPMTERIRDSLLGFLATMGPDCCIRAMDEAVELGKISWRYVETILKNKRDQGVRSIEDWEKAEKNRPGKKAPSASFQATPDRIQENNDWLDKFLADQEKSK